MLEYYVLNRDPRATEVFEFIKDRRLALEVHLNRTRFWVPSTGTVYTEFALRFADVCVSVDPTLDTATGLPRDSE